MTLREHAPRCLPLSSKNTDEGFTKWTSRYALRKRSSSSTELVIEMSSCFQSMCLPLQSSPHTGGEYGPSRGGLQDKEQTMVSL